MNRIIKFLMLSDILIFTGFGLVEPILAIFFKENLVGGSILTAGIAGMIFLLVKSVIQLPFSRYIDKRSYKTRLHWLIVGSFFVSIVPFIYIFAKHIYVVFAIQVVYGIGAGLAYPAWLGLWSTHLDKGNESFEWSLYSTLTGLGLAVTAAVGAALAEFVGFTFTFVVVGCISLLGCLALLVLGNMKEKEDVKMVVAYQNKRHSVKKPGNF